jgi:hypothetical protein
MFRIFYYSDVCKVCKLLEKVNMKNAKLTVTSVAKIT